MGKSSRANETCDGCGNLICSGLPEDDLIGFCSGSTHNLEHPAPSPCDLCKDKSICSTDGQTLVNCVEELDPAYICECSCGNKVVARGSELDSGVITSCGSC